jgi:hypothetical protein
MILYCYHCLPTMTKAITLNQGQAECLEHAMEYKNALSAYATAITEDLHEKLSKPRQAPPIMSQ